MAMRRGLKILLGFQPYRLELIALLPSDKAGQSRGLPAEGEAEARHRSVADEVHLWPVFIARLMIPFLYILLVLREAPSKIVALKLHSLIDGKRWNAYPRQAEMIGTVKVSSLRTGVRANVQAKFFGGRLHPGIKRSSLRSSNLNFFRSADRLHVIVIKVERDLSRRKRRMLPQKLRSQ